MDVGYRSFSCGGRASGTNVRPPVQRARPRGPCRARPVSSGTCGAGLHASGSWAHPGPAGLGSGVEVAMLPCTGMIGLRLGRERASSAQVFEGHM